VSKLLIALVAGSAALFASNVTAAPLNAGIPLLDSGAEQVRMVCDQSGRCWRERRGARRVIIQRESYGYDRRRHRHHHDRPAVGIRVPGVSIGVGDGRRW
jgi:hypothetical protein